MSSRSYAQRLRNLVYIMNKKRFKPADSAEEEDTSSAMTGLITMFERNQIDKTDVYYDPNISVNLYMYISTTTGKRERKNDPEESRPPKRRDVPDSTSTSIPAFRGARYMASSKNALSAAQMLYNKNARAAVKAARLKTIRNPKPMKPCSYCIEEDIYVSQAPHSSRISALFPSQIQNTDEYIEENVGKDYRRFTRKHGLEKLVILE